MQSVHSQYNAALADYYDRDRESEAHWCIENDFVSDYFAGRKTGHVLDAPVGTGRFLSFYKNASEVQGIDQSVDMLRVASRRAAELSLQGVQLHEADLFALPFGDRHFDVSVCWRFAHLIARERLAAALQELNRVTAGEILLQAYVRGKFWSRLQHRIFNFPARWLGRLRVCGNSPKSWSHIHAYFHSMATFEQAIVRADLRLVRKQLLCHYQGHEVFVLVLSAA